MDSFHSNIRMKDGRANVCKICVSEYNKQNKKEKKKETISVDLRTGKLHKGEYCDFWKFLAGIGYNINEDIHEQFCAKYNLPTKPKPQYKIEWCKADCFNTEQ